MPIFPRRVFLALAVFCAAVTATPASAWWEYGHETVGSIALANVKPSTRTAIEALLRKQGLLETPTCPARTIEEAAVWSDCVKGLGQRFSYMSSWHYQDHDVCKAFDIKAECKDGNCLSAQIDRQMKLLKDGKVPQRERLMALILLVHFVGDLEQPLHDSEHDGDGGGNGMNADYGIVHGARMNIHKIWDGYLAERAISTPESLVRTYSDADKARLTQGVVADWMRESWEVAKASVYPTALGPDYCSKPGKSQGAVSEQEIETLIPVVREQVVKGGLRLARLLDEALGA
jgi:hypothetical protein